ncbi:uracil-DNA glycosylase-like protein [Russula vinacea]|nr:uracil-DNA glycosylase-like protein [Russula vinacea]
MARHVSSRVRREFNGRSPRRLSVHNHRIPNAFSTAIPLENCIVYMEDLESPSSQVTVASKDEKLSTAAPSDPDHDESTNTKPKPASSTSTINGKRQRTLFDMLGSAPSQGSDTRSKKPKLTASSPGLQSLNSIPFSSTEYVASLTADQKRLLKLECETMGKSWLKVLKDEIRKPYFISLKNSSGKRAAEDLKVYPARKIYIRPARAIPGLTPHGYGHSTEYLLMVKLYPLGKVRVVMIGQDPYHGPGQAHGLCFSVPHGVTTPPSLRNIYTEIKAEYEGFVPPKHGNLTAWAEAGVLMLNTCLTVRARSAGSHQGKGWEQFTDRVIEVVDRYGGANLGEKSGLGQGVVFLAWGSWAAKRVAKLNKHPSPLSASRGFFGNGHFQKANDWLEARYGPDGRVDWSQLGPVI